MSGANVRLDLDAIEARARAATPGPWMHRDRPSHGFEEAGVSHEGEEDDGALAKVWGGAARGTANAAHIAGMDPPTALAIVAVVRRLRGALVDILDVSRDRARFVAQGPRGWLKAEQIASDALRAAGVDPDA